MEGVGGGVVVEGEVFPVGVVGVEEEEVREGLGRSVVSILKLLFVGRISSKEDLLSGMGVPTLWGMEEDIEMMESLFAFILSW